MRYPALRRLLRPAPACAQSLRVRSLAFAVVTLLLAIVPVVIVCSYAIRLLRNIPMWDEFETVLEFLVDYQSAVTWTEMLQPFFTMANEHCMVTSRVLVVMLYELTGQANFIHLAVMGDLFILGAVGLLVLQEQPWRSRLVLLALSSLLLFHLQHHENFFSSYASIDHFLVVMLTTATLVCVQRGRPGFLVLGGIAATLAVFTLAHGLAVLASALVILVLRAPRRHQVVWFLFSLALASVYLWKLRAVPLDSASAFTLADAGRTVVYALALLGGVPSIGTLAGARVMGLLLLVTFGYIFWKQGWRREPILFGVAMTAVISAFLIAYGRANASEVSPLSSRYMVQSSVAWISILMIWVKSPGPALGFSSRAWGILALAVVINTLGSLSFAGPAREFVQRRIDAARHYDVAQTLSGNDVKIFPRSDRADEILLAAAREGVFRLKPRKSIEVEMDVPLREHRISYYLDKIAVGPRSVHLKGWMFADDYDSGELQPHVMLKTGEQTYFFRGRRESRPDVATAMRRSEARECGFYFVIPKQGLSADEFRLSLVLKDEDQALYSNTDHRVLIQDLEEVEVGEASEF